MSALPLPVLTRAQAARTRRCCAPRAIVPLLDGTRLQWAGPGSETSEPVADVRITLSLGENLLHVFMPREMLEICMTALDPTLVPETVPDDLAALLLETASRDDLDRLETLCGKPVAIVALARGATAANAAHRLVAEHGEHRWAVDLSTDDAGLVDPAMRPLEMLVRRWPLAPRPLSRLPLRAAVRLGTTWLARGDLASLRSGDAVLVQFTEEAGARLVVLESLLAAARQEEGRWILTQPPHRARHPDQREWTMQHDTDAAPPDLAASDLDEVPMQLVFDLGTVAMTLGELRTLGAGAVIELNRDLKQLVRISAHGALVGQGELVEVEGHMGVRIVRLFDHD